MTTIADMSPKDLVDLINKAVADAMQSQRATKARTYVHGLKGIADLFGVSTSQAKRIKASGAIDKAIAQRGRTIVVDAEKAYQLFQK